MSWRWFDCMTNTYHNIKDEKEMTLDEKCFRKMGFDLVKGKTSQYYYWVDAIGLEANFMDNTICDTESGATRKLPPISSVWEVCAKYLVPFMQNKNWHINLDCITIKRDGSATNKLSFCFRNPKVGPYIISAEIKNNNIAEAACKAFMEVEL